MVGVVIGVWIMEVPLVIGVTSIKSKPFHNNQNHFTKKRKKRVPGATGTHKNKNITKISKNYPVKNNSLHKFKNVCSLCKACTCVQHTVIHFYRYSKCQLYTYFKTGNKSPLSLKSRTVGRSKRTPQFSCLGRL